MATFLEMLQPLKESGSPAVRRMLTADPTEDLLIDAHLAPWKESVFTDGQPTLLQQAIALLPVHSALKFARFLKHGYDTQWDMTGAVPKHLEQLRPQ